MSVSLFTLHQVTLGFKEKDKETPVLYIDNLTLPRGKMIFILGASGSGKSTFLEALGLMNDTFLGESNKQSLVMTEQDNLIQSWKDQDWGHIERIRKDKYSFIFQEANFLGHYSNLENVLIPSSLQHDKEREQAVPELAGKLSGLAASCQLPEDLEDDFWSRYPKETSLGQRQRIAFIRATLPDYEVLFADEPTGNLDPANAHALLDALEQDLKERNKKEAKASAIIVTHDLALAQRYADLIYILEPDKEKNYSVLHNPEGWAKGSPQMETLESLFAAIPYLKGYPETEYFEELNKLESNKGVEKEGKGKASNQTIGAPLPSLHEDRFFFRREFLQLSSFSQWRQWVPIFLVFILSFLAFGIGSGTQKFLNKELGKPFVKWLDLSIPFGRADALENIETLKKQLANSGSQVISLDHIHLDPYLIPRPKLIRKEDSTALYGVKSQVLSYEDSLLKDAILANDNLSNGKWAANEHEYGWQDSLVAVILTEDCMRDFGYSKQDRTVKMEVNGIAVPIPVFRVVKYLPGNHKLCYGKTFMRAYGFAQNAKKKDPFFQGLVEGGILYFSYEKAEFLEMLEGTKKAIPGISNVKKSLPTRVSFFTPFPKANWMEVSLQKKNPSEDILNTKRRVLEEIEQRYAGQYAFILSYEYPIDDTLLYGKYKKRFDFEPSTGLNISIYLDSLHKVTDLQRLIRKTFNDLTNPEHLEHPIELDFSKVRDKQLLSILSNLMTVLFVVIFLLAVIGSASFTASLTENYFNRISVEMGTLIAFGFEEKRLRSIFRRVIFLMVSLLLASSLFIAFLIGLLIDYRLGTGQVGTSLTEISSGTSFFQLLTWRVLILFVFPLALILWTALSLKLKKLFKQTPGDLVYRR